MNLSKDGRYLLANVSMKKPHIDCWDLIQGACVRQYVGHVQSDYILRPVFGGADESLVLCGSEDCFIYVWSRKLGVLLSKIGGHF